MMTAVVTDKRNGSEVRYENVVRVEKVGHVIEIHFSDWTHEVHSDTCTVFLEFSDYVNIQKNDDGSWSKAEPCKASWQSKFENQKYLKRIFFNVGIFLIKFGILLAMLRLARRLGVI